VAALFLKPYYYSKLSQVTPRASSLARIRVPCGLVSKWVVCVTQFDFTLADEQLQGLSLDFQVIFF
jgi:hypothetical protein